jgi:hypothetical protein
MVVSYDVRCDVTVVSLMLEKHTNRHEKKSAKKLGVPHGVL